MYCHSAGSLSCFDAPAQPFLAGFGHAVALHLVVLAGVLIGTGSTHGKQAADGGCNRHVLEIHDG
jgi:hypothetical protein